MHFRAQQLPCWCQRQTHRNNRSCKLQPVQQRPSPQACWEPRRAELCVQSCLSPAQSSVWGLTDASARCHVGGAAAAAATPLPGQPIPVSPLVGQPADTGTVADTACELAKTAAQQALLEAVTARSFSRKAFNERSVRPDSPTPLSCPSLCSWAFPRAAHSIADVASAVPYQRPGQNATWEHADGKNSPTYK